MRALAEEILLDQRNHQGKVYLFTSAVSGEGVTHVVSSLAEELGLLHTGSVFLYREGDMPEGEAECDNKTRSDFLSKLRDEYSLILVDASAVLVKSCSLPFFDECDAAVLVVRAEATDRTLIKEALATLKRYEVRVLGTVLNGTIQRIPSCLYRLMR
jgi:Mrp family chromosome partitioning ATPase